MAYTPKGKGAGVVKDVVDTINGLGIFPNDHKFLCRVAWVESKYGEDPNTYRSGYYGGIWQVSGLFQINYDKKKTAKTKATSVFSRYRTPKFLILAELTI